MKKILHLALMCLLMFNIAEAQTRAKIVNEPVTPHSLTTLGLDATTNSVSPGLDVVAKGTYVYLSAKNIGDTNSVQSAVFTLTTKPGGSTAEITPFGSTWAYFQPDVVGAYTVTLSVTTAGGTDDTTKVITAANYVGVGNFEGVAATFPQCMSCHAAMPKFSAIFDRWKVSGHANIFKNQIIAGDHYSASCMKCHTTGMDHNVVAANNGFDDIAANLGWSYVPPSSQAKWDSLVTYYPTLVNFGTIGCENCHGAGSEHALGGIKSKIQITLEAGMCAQCHDEPWRHNKYAEFENSMHAEALWSGSFSQGESSQNNSLSNCIRCHDAKGFVNFTNGVTTNTTGMVAADHVAITCQACHDPHGNTNVASLRSVPESSDTLGNGFAYTADQVGLGKTCMSCHKARRDVDLYTASGTVSSHWGPHHSVQADVLLGQNAASFGSEYISNGAHKFIENTCVTCHMSESPANGNENRDKVGNHTFKLHNEENGYDHTVACTSCHGPKENFNTSFMAVVDNDGDGNIETIREEIAGLESLLRFYLPPVGSDDIDYTAITTTELRKAYWNYQLIAYDGSGGMHNSRFAVDVLTKTIIAIGGVVPVQMTSFTADAVGRTVVLNWETATETNNKGFEVERKTNKSFERVTFISGNGTTSEMKKYSFTDKIDNYNGVVVYRIKQIDFDGTYQYSKEVEVELSVPEEFKLSQNYPNPFNPSTKITYSVPVDSRVKVSVYSISGELVKELVNTNQVAGEYEFEFNTNSVNSNLSSGIYFYSIEAVSADGLKTFKQTKKMVLLK